MGELPGRVALATFGELDTYREAFDRHPDQVAAVVVEPVQYTGVVTPPPDGFLSELRELTRTTGALYVLDDCLMFRLAEGGSAERFGIADADITCLGKWIGGGLPVGAITASAELMEHFDPTREDPLYHGGSFNGHLLGCIAGEIAVGALTTAEIARIDAIGDEMRIALQDAADAAELPVMTSGIGSAFGLYVLHEPGGDIDWARSSLLHLAAVNHGVYLGSGGEFGLSTAVDADVASAAIRGITDAITDVAAMGTAPQAVNEPV